MQKELKTKCCRLTQLTFNAGTMFIEADYFPMSTHQSTMHSRILLPTCRITKIILNIMVPGKQAYQENLDVSTAFENNLKRSHTSQCGLRINMGHCDSRAFMVKGPATSKNHQDNHVSWLWLAFMDTTSVLWNLILNDKKFQMVDMLSLYIL